MIHRNTKTNLSDPVEMMLTGTFIFLSDKNI